MHDSPYPAVRDMALVAGASLVTALAACAALLLTNDDDGTLGAMALAALVVVVIAPFASRRVAGPIVAEADEVDDAIPREGLGPPARGAIVSAGLTFGLSFGLGLIAPALAGAAVGTALSSLCAVGWLRLWERKHGRQLLYRPIRRRAGTGPRVLGRGWFDPANFVSAPS
jgi:hypothetical protein